MPEPPNATPQAAQNDTVQLLRAILTALEAGPAEGLGPQEAAAFLGISTALLHRLNSAGNIPSPSELSDRCPRWSRTELRAWLLAGSPHRLRWQAMRDAAIRRAG